MQNCVRKLHCAREHVADWAEYYGTADSWFLEPLYPLLQPFQTTTLFMINLREVRKDLDRFKSAIASNSGNRRPRSHFLQSELHEVVTGVTIDVQRVESPGREREASAAYKVDLSWYFCLLPARKKSPGLGLGIIVLLTQGFKWLWECPVGLFSRHLETTVKFGSSTDR